MILDADQYFSNEQAITGDAYSTKSYPLGGDPGVGEALSLLFKVDDNFDKLTSLDISLVADDDGAGTNEVVLVTANYLAAALVEAAGVRRVGIARPTAEKKFMRVKYNVNGTDPDNGKITAWFVKGDDAVPFNAGVTLV